MKHVILIYNPISGDAGISTRLDHVAALHQKEGYNLTLLRITREHGFHNLAELDQALKPAYLIVAGGDGTVNRLVNYMREHSIGTPLAILPTGTANDFGRLIGMPSDAIKAVRAILGGTIEHIDLGRVGDRYFVNVFSSGLFTDVSHRTPTALKNTLGRLAYYISSIGELPSFRKLSVKIESPEVTYEGKCLLLLVFNGRTAGTVRLARQASATDGLLDVLVIKGESVLSNIKTVYHILSGRSGGYPDDVLYFQTAKLHIECHQHVTSDIDGERGGGFPADIECLPGALRVIVPARR